MNIDRQTPERIRQSADSFDEMFGDLSDFADIVGGKAWQNNRSRRVGLQRSMSLYFDDLGDPETISDALCLDETPEAEDIAVSFDAEKDLFDNGYFYTSYDIGYSHELPVNFGDIPEQYQEQLREQMRDYNTDNDTQLALEQLTTISEIHTHRYSILEEDDTIAYSEEVTYLWAGSIEVEGQSFHSINQREIIHGKNVDGFAYELGQYEDQVESQTSDDPETVIYDHKFAEMTDDNEDIDTLFHSSDEHARRIRALLSLLGSDLIGNKN